MSYVLTKKPARIVLQATLPERWQLIFLRSLIASIIDTNFTKTTEIIWALKPILESCNYVKKSMSRHSIILKLIIYKLSYG